MSFRGGRGGGRGGRKNFGGRDREFEEGPPERVVGGCCPTRVICRAWICDARKRG